MCSASLCRKWSPSSRRRFLFARFLFAHFLPSALGAFARRPPDKTVPVNAAPHAGRLPKARAVCRKRGPFAENFSASAARICSCPGPRVFARGPGQFFLQFTSIACMIGLYKIWELARSTQRRPGCYVPCIIPQNPNEEALRWPKKWWKRRSPPRCRSILRRVYFWPAPAFFPSTGSRICSSSARSRWARMPLQKSGSRRA